MPTPHLPRLKPGQMPTAAEWNELCDLVGRAGLVSGTAFGDTGTATGLGGVQILDGRPAGHWAKIGARGTGAVYAHVSAVPDGDGTFTDLPTTDGQYEYGTTTSAPAREINGDTGVAEGTYVWVWPDPTGTSAGYLFTAPGGASCCGTASDYYTATFPTISGSDVPYSLATGIVSEVVHQTFLTIPANSGRVRIRGGFLAVFEFAGGSEPVGLNRSLVINVRVVPVTSLGVVTGGTASNWLPALRAGWDTTSNSGNYPVGRHGPMGVMADVLATGFAGDQVVTEFELPDNASAAYIAWQIGGGWSGSLPIAGGNIWATGIGRGGTWLLWEKVCCAEDPIAPPAQPPLMPPTGMTVHQQSEVSIEALWSQRLGNPAGPGMPGSTRLEPGEG